MKYFIFEKTKEGYIYSCDKICILGKVDFNNLNSFGLEISKFFLSSLVSPKDSDAFPWPTVQLLDYYNYPKFGRGEYRNNLSVKLSNNSSFYFAYSHNSDNKNNCSFKLELNPNKCLPCDFVSNLLLFLRSRSQAFRISQIDLAIDFPFNRKSFNLAKDKRIYTQINDGENNITEYLSKHNSHGFTKLYNKTVESKLDYDLTRLEITLKEFDVVEVSRVFPIVRFADFSQIKLNECLPKLSQNDEVLLELIRMHSDYFNKLSRRKKTLLKPYLNYDKPIYQFNADVYLKLFNKVKEFFIYG